MCYMCACACVRALHACMRACARVCACVRVCVCACVRARADRVVVCVCAPPIVRACACVCESEGAEFTVLPHMLAHGRLLCGVTQMHIEWHLPALPLTPSEPLMGGVGLRMALTHLLEGACAGTKGVPGSGTPWIDHEESAGPGASRRVALRAIEGTFDVPPSGAGGKKRAFHDVCVSCQERPHKRILVDRCMSFIMKNMLIMYQLIVIMSSTTS